MKRRRLIFNIILLLYSAHARRRPYNGFNSADNLPQRQAAHRRITAVLAVVAVVAHYEHMIFRYGDPLQYRHR